MNIIGWFYNINNNNKIIVINLNHYVLRITCIVGNNMKYLSSEGQIKNIGVVNSLVLLWVKMLY